MNKAHFGWCVMHGSYNGAACPQCVLPSATDLTRFKRQLFLLARCGIPFHSMAALHYPDGTLQIVLKGAFTPPDSGV